MLTDIYSRLEISLLLAYQAYNLAELLLCLLF